MKRDSREGRTRRLPRQRMRHIADLLMRGERGAPMLHSSSSSPYTSALEQRGGVQLPFAAAAAAAAIGSPYGALHAAAHHRAMATTPGMGGSTRIADQVCGAFRRSSSLNGSFVRQQQHAAAAARADAELSTTALGGGGSAGHHGPRKDGQLGDKEKQYLLAVERGDMASVRSLLQAAQREPLLDMNCHDPLGRTALLIAIESENVEMLELLLSFDVAIGDAVLHAINEENVEAVELLFKHLDVKKEKSSAEAAASDRGGGNTSSGVSTSPPPPPYAATAASTTAQSDSFTPDITPLMLAAHRDNYEIIKLLLDRGETIPKPHNVYCACSSCVRQNHDDTLCHSRSRINAYRALSSPSLISLSSRDPVLTAFELSWELRSLSRVEHEFTHDYERLARQVQSYAVDLLDQTRGSGELETILNHDTESPVSVLPSSGSIDNGGEGEDGGAGNGGRSDRMTLSRLRLAIKYKQKNFVAHPHCQQLLATIWYDGLPGFRRRHIVYRVLMTLAIGMFFPLWSVIYILAPKTRWGQLMTKPFIKFIAHSSSYCLFLFLLILTSQRIDSIIVTSSDNKAKSEVRGSAPTVIEWMILSYVAGLVWAEAKQLWDQGIVEYIHDMWNILDFITNTLYIATTSLKAIAYLKVMEELRLGLPSAHLARTDWDAYDPNLIAESLFAAANIFSTLKLVYIFSVNPYLGPLQISLGRMVVDILKFGVVYFLVLFSFACGLNQLLWYYADLAQKTCLAAPTSGACESKFLQAFHNLFEIIQTLYWAIFGLVDLDSLELQANHTFTQFSGKVMFGTYCYISIIVLLNMLVAMMNNSYQWIWDQADLEWKFARSRLWLSYFEDGGTLPAPFNIIPTPKSLWYLALWIRNLLCRCSAKHKTNRWLTIRKVVKKINEREAKYQAVMRNLIKRYVMNRSREKVDEGVTEDDINEIKQDISSFRYELLEILKNNGMTMPSYYKPAMSSQNTIKMKRRKSYMKKWQKLEKRQDSFSSQNSEDCPSSGVENGGGGGGSGSESSANTSGQQQQQQQKMKSSPGMSSASAPVFATASSRSFSYDPKAAGRYRKLERMASIDQKDELMHEEAAAAAEAAAAICAESSSSLPAAAAAPRTRTLVPFTLGDADSVGVDVTARLQQEQPSTASPLPPGSGGREQKSLRGMSSGSKKVSFGQMSGGKLDEGDYSGRTTPTTTTESLNPSIALSTSATAADGHNTAV